VIGYFITPLTYYNSNDYQLPRQTLIRSRCTRFEKKIKWIKDKLHDFLEITCFFTKKLYISFYTIPGDIFELWLSRDYVEFYFLKNV